MVFNESFIDLSKGTLTRDLATMVHETLHTLYFHPNLFLNFPKNTKGESFYVTESNRSYIQGNEVMKIVQEHFQCPSILKSFRFSKLLKYNTNLLAPFTQIHHDLLIKYFNIQVH